jgi:hypothetical protein
MGWVLLVMRFHDLHHLRSTTLLWVVLTQCTCYLGCCLYNTVKVAHVAFKACQLSLVSAGQALDGQAMHA